MQEEQGVGDAGTDAGGGRPIARASTGVESVASDQLWRDAVVAAREAALTLVELRRSLDGGALAPPPG